MRKSRFSQNPLNARFWAFGFLIYTSSSTNFKKNPPWYIFFVSVHVPATSALSLTHWLTHWRPFGIDVTTLLKCRLYRRKYPHNLQAFKIVRKLPFLGVFYKLFAKNFHFRRLFKPVLPCFFVSRFTPEEEQPTSLFESASVICEFFSNIQL